MGLKLSIEGLMDGSKCTGFCTEYFGFSCVPKSHVEHMICLISIDTTIYNYKIKKEKEIVLMDSNWEEGTIQPQPYQIHSYPSAYCTHKS